MLVAEISEIKERSQEFLAKAQEIAQKSKRAFYEFRKTNTTKKNEVLQRVMELLSEPKNQTLLLEQNEKDLQQAKEMQLSSSMIERLLLNPKRIQELIKAIDDIIKLPDPVGEIIKGYTLPNGLELIQKRVPLGSIFVIYESRPNVTIDVGALCIKSGNTVILRGGKEAFHTNKVLFEFFQNSLEKAGLSRDIVQFVDNPDRAFMYALLQQDAYLDLVVPRGGEGLIQFVSSHTRIPIVKHDKGVCNLYIDKSADLEKAIVVSINAKLQRPSVCNAIENLVIHKDFPFKRELLEALWNAGAIILGCEETIKIFEKATLIEDPEKEYSTEYLDQRLSVKIVEDLNEAIDFIHTYGSHHSEGIISEDYSIVEEFLQRVDSAALFVNSSTRFHDGGQFGMGAEIGISTQRLHVRGPMGLKDLTTTVYIVKGNGHIRT
ncbi:MAG: glutamate-5-semialdehyde dehydrogenase [Leptospiraceae bacterium]|nr:glutamate-5-semialdehyde dehydrogenase [Leptospiraceae bacterium]